METKQNMFYFQIILEQALGHSEEIVTKRTINNLESEITKIENRVQREEKRYLSSIY